VGLIDQVGVTSWPIVSATFLLVPQDPKDPAYASSVLKWVDWAYNNGGAIATQPEYVPLPKAVQDSVRSAWRGSIMAGGSAVHSAIHKWGAAYPDIRWSWAPSLLDPSFRDVIIVPSRRRSVHTAARVPKGPLRCLAACLATEADGR